MNQQIVDHFSATITWHSLIRTQFLLFLLIFISVTTAESQINNTDKLVVNVINLDRNVGRWNEMVSNWESMFELRRVSAKTHKNPVCGLALSQLSLFKAFKKSNDSYLLVMEDDAYPGLWQAGKYAPDMSVKFIRAALKSASRLENWYVLNFGPWFTRQPILLRRIGAHLVQVDYCHTAHFVAFPRRAIRSTLRDYAKLINSGNCVPFDDWFGKYGNVHHKHDIITTSKVMALQNKYNKSDIGGGPVMDSCAINAALKGRRVEVKINTKHNAAGQVTSVWFDPPKFGYRVPADDEDEDDVDGSSAGIRWSRRCNYDSDRWTDAAKASEIAAKTDEL